jgi:hypothetical protein
MKTFASRSALEKARPFKEPIVTPVVAATEFFPAEVGARFLSTYGDVEAVVVSAEWDAP